ncbi:hypothetical protein ACOME3_001428 [Neoechinorhynchus agilis]
MTDASRIIDRGSIEEIVRKSGMDRFVTVEDGSPTKDSRRSRSQFSLSRTSNDSVRAKHRSLSRPRTTRQTPKSCRTPRTSRSISAESCYCSDTSNDDEISISVFDHPREVLRMPTPPPILRRIVERAPTPTPFVIERVIIKPSPQRIVERIIERPQTPPPKIVEKEVFETPPPPIIKTRIIKVEAWPTMPAMHYGPPCSYYYYQPEGAIYNPHESRSYSSTQSQQDNYQLYDDFSSDCSSCSSAKSSNVSRLCAKYEEGNVQFINPDTAPQFPVPNNYQSFIPRNPQTGMYSVPFVPCNLHNAWHPNLPFGSWTNTIAGPQFTYFYPNQQEQSMRRIPNSFGGGFMPSFHFN